MRWRLRLFAFPLVFPLGKRNATGVNADTRQANIQNYKSWTALLQIIPFFPVPSRLSERGICIGTHSQYVEKPARELLTAVSA